MLPPVMTPSSRQMRSRLELLPALLRLMKRLRLTLRIDILLSSVREEASDMLTFRSLRFVSVNGNHSTGPMLYNCMHMAKSFELT